MGLRYTAVRIATGTIVSVTLVACAATQPPTVPSASPGLPGTASAEVTPAPGGDAAAVGRAFIAALAAGDTATAESMEDSTMRAAAPADALANLWGQIESQFGAFGSIASVEVADSPPFTNVTVGTTFANATLPLIVTVSSEGKVSGLHLGQPAPASPASSAAPATASPAPWVAPSPAAYVDPTAFEDRDVTVGDPPWQLPGSLSMPNGNGPFPAVVLLAGSGPQDRDETIGSNKPLADLAGGLASVGIAVLRYDKRTNVYGPQMAADAATVTVEQEVIEDAIAAVALLRRTPGVDPERVFVVGHSLGGYLAPRVATEAAEAGEPVAGIGILEGNTSRLQDLILRQYEYLASPEGGADPQASAALPTIRQQVALADSPELSPSTPSSALPLGVPAAYWIDLNAYDPAGTAAALRIPIFISQGGRDYQVPPSELQGWRTALAGRDDITMYEYPDLNHLLISGSGPARPADYAVAGHVAPEVVADLAAWVLRP